MERERVVCVGGGGEERKWFRKRVSVCARMCCSLIMSLSKLVAVMEIAAGHVTLSLLFHWLTLSVCSYQHNMHVHKELQ